LVEEYELLEKTNGNFDNKTENLKKNQRKAEKSKKTNLVNGETLKY